MNALSSLLMLVLAGELVSSAQFHHPRPLRPYNILVLSPFSPPSHYSILMPIAAALADRGHKVTMLTNHQVSPTRKNITTLTHGLSYSQTTDNLDHLKIGRSSIEITKHFPEILEDMRRELYRTPVVADLYKRKDEFDVVFIDFFFNEIAHPFVAGKPFISIPLCCNDPAHSLSFGNMLNSAYISHPFKHNAGPLSVPGRIEAYFVTSVLPLLRYWGTFGSVPDHEFPELGSLVEVERNQSAMFMTSLYSLVAPVEFLLPSQVDIRGIHCREGKPLPKDILDFVSTEVPVILMSLGTAVSGKFMSQSHKDMFRSAFSKLPYRIIWIFDDPISMSANVMIRDWLPQQDILAHPNVKLFITHGGLLGVQEALHHATPMLALPSFSDQPKNADRIEEFGIGLVLSWYDVSEKNIVESVTKIITQPKYRKRALKASAIFRDQKEAPSDRVVFWTEYVVRHKAARHLFSPERDLSWIQTQLFDIYVILLLLLYVWYKFNVYFVLPQLRRLIKFCKNILFKENRNPRKLD